MLHVCENVSLLVTHILEKVHNRNYNVRATCSNSVSDGLCVRTHNFSLFTQRHFNCVYLLKKGKQGVPGCLCHTQTYTHWDLKQSCLYAPHSACFYSSLMSPRVNRGSSQPPSVSCLWKEQIQSIFSAEQQGEAQREAVHRYQTTH